MKLDNKAKTILVTLIGTIGAAVLSAWNGGTTWHEAIGVAFGALVVGVTTYLVPNAPTGQTPPEVK